MRINLKASDWQDPDPLPEGRIKGPLRLDYRTLKAGKSLAIHTGSPSRSYQVPVSFDADLSIPIVSLETVGHWSWWDVVMSVTPSEWLSHWRFLKRARGRVLLVGLGLGLSVRWLTRQSAVKRVTVIEKEEALIRLHEPRLPKDRVDLVCADFWKVAGKLPREFDCAWVDIWNDIENGDTTPQRKEAVALLKAHAVKASGHCSAWSGYGRIEDVWPLQSGIIPPPFK